MPLEKLHVALVRRAFVLGRRCLAGVLSASILLLSAVVANASGSDCGAVNQGFLNVELQSGALTTREVKLGPGDTVTFILAAADGSFGSLTLVGGAGSPRGLLAGPAGTKVFFVAPRNGSYGYQFAAEGTEEGVAFTAGCVSAREAAREQTAASRRAARLLAGNARLGQVVPGEEPAAGATIDQDIMVADQSSGRSALTGSAGWQGAFAKASRPAPGLDVWLQGGDRRYALGAAGDGAQVTAGGTGLTGGGPNYKGLPQIMVGALVQLDQYPEPAIGGPSNSDRGWLAGPVTTVQLAPGLSLDARAAWGAADSGAASLAASGSSAERRLVNARGSDTPTFGRWRFTPSINVNYVEEALRSTEAASHMVGSGRVDVRPEVGYRFNVENGTFVEPKAALSSFWDIDSLSKLKPVGGHDDMRLKAEAGVTVGTTYGTKVQATGGVEEGAAGASDIWSGRFQFNLPLK